MYRVNVSSIQDFQQCQFRWWCKWVMNRVPVASSPALDAGKLLHLIFEDHFREGTSLVQAASSRCRAFRDEMESSTTHPSARSTAEKAVVSIEDLSEAFTIWEDMYPVEDTLEVEEPFEYPDTQSDILWLGRPDRVVVMTNRLYHYQNRGLAAGMNFGTYVRLAKRHYHEHLYGEYLEKKYCRPWKKKAPAKLRYGGTLFNLVRKLKFRTNVGKKNEAVKTAAEMFWQHPVSYDTTSGLHKSVMQSMRLHVRNMREVERRWHEENEVPAPNEKMNGGYGGNSEDPFFKVLIGEISLDDDEHFKAREDMYSNQDAEAA